MPKKIKTRFAPSPTGELHVGGLRTALYNYLFAKHNDGDFVLRIEDTDKKRTVHGALENILGVLNKMGLEHGENFYVQSQHLDIYQKYTDELIKNKKAYYCFCAPERLKKMREDQQAKKEPTRYDRRCRNLKQEEIDKFLKENKPRTIRLKIPETGRTGFEDLIYGKISVENKTLDDQILVKSDGYPTYHLASVVDDHLMEISHVIRGEEWLPSTPKHILLYQAFGWEPPQFVHLPLLLNPDKSKLSKRQGDVAVEDYLKKGYLPEALLNFILLLGWNPKTEEEIFSLGEMIKKFDLSGVNKYGAVFNLEKLDWINGVYIRGMELGKLTKLCAPYLEKDNLIKKLPDSKFQILDSKEEISFDYLKKVVALEQERMKKLSEIGELVKFVFVDKLKYDKNLLVWKKMSFEEVKKNLELACQELEKISEEDFTKDNLEKVLRDLMARENIKTGELLWPLRVALTGLKGSPGPFEVGEVLGKERVLGRVKVAICLLE